MFFQHNDLRNSGVFITFSGNCKQALTFYQACFGGTLHFDLFDQGVHGYEQIPVVNGSLISDRIVIYGSDLVHDEGRKIGNYVAIFLSCKSKADRQRLLEQLLSDTAKKVDAETSAWIEIVDAFEVRWILSA